MRQQLIHHLLTQIKVEPSEDIGYIQAKLIQKFVHAAVTHIFFDLNTSKNHNGVTAAVLTVIKSKRHILFTEPH